MTNQYGVKAIYSSADMTKPDQIADMLGQAEREMGGVVDILINNAGIQFVSPIEKFPIERWDQILAINLSAAFHAIRAALPVMKAAGGGTDYLDGFSPFSGRSPFQGRLCRRQARPRRSDQDSGSRAEPTTSR
jgi:NAD(P)-dependent dehydrogenase (short-subunit alcohol dehydrogenase family)